MPPTKKSSVSPSFDRSRRASWASPQPHAAQKAFPSRSHVAALDQLVAAIRRGERIVVATGAPGAGKTTLCLALRQESDELTFVTTVFDPRLKPEQLLARMLRDFGLITESQAQATQPGDRQALASAVSRFLASLRLLGARAVVVVDDAEQVSVDTLEELRHLSEPSEGEPSRLRLVLIGRAPVDSLLKREFQTLDREVTTRVRLSALGPDEILPYALHRQRDRRGVLGEGGDTADQALTARLTAPVVSRIYEQTGGIPSLVNDLVGAALDTTDDVEDAHGTQTPSTSVPSESPAASGRGFLASVVALVTIGLAVGGWWWTRGPVVPAERAAAQMRDPGLSGSPVAVADRAVTIPADPSNADRPVRAVEVEGSARSQLDTPAPAFTEQVAAAAGSPAVAPPETETAPIERPIGTTGQPSSATGAYRITVASFRSPENAAEAVAMLKALNLAPDIVVVEQERWHRVFAGPFETREDAAAAQRMLAGAGFPDTLVNPAR